MKQKFYILCCLLGSVAFHPHQMSAEGTPNALQQGPHDAQLRDVRIHYVVRGRGPLVFMSSVGWGLGSLEYQNAFRPLEKQFTMVYVDERGNGESPLPSDLTQMSTSVMADDLNHLREYLGLSKLRLMGHSSGGAIALEYAERYPESLEKAVLIDPVVLLVIVKRNRLQNIWCYGRTIRSTNAPSRTQKSQMIQGRTSKLPQISFPLLTSISQIPTVMCKFS